MAARLRRFHQTNKLGNALPSLTRAGTSWNAAPYGAKAGEMGTARSTSGRVWAHHAASTPLTDRPATVRWSPRPLAISTVWLAYAVYSARLSLARSRVRRSI